MSAAGAWPLLAALLGSVVGVGLQLQQPELWPAWLYAGLVLAALGGGWPLRRHVALAGVTAMLLFGLTGWRAAVYQGEALSAGLEGQDLVLQGCIASLPQQGERGSQFEFEVETAHQGGVGVVVPGRVRLSWGEGWGQRASGPAVASTVPNLRAGQRWRFTVRLRAPHGTANPHGFDTELWLWEQGLHATGSVRHGPKQAPPVLLGQTWRHPVEQTRQAVRDALLAQVSDPRQAGVMAALVLGDQAAIAPSDWELFRRTGVAHLISVSGTHITMFAALAVGLLGWAWRQAARWWPHLLWRLPAPVAGHLGGLLLATAYAVFSGWGVPAQRTVLMLATVIGLRLSGRRWPWPVVWLAAMNVVLLIDPWALLQPGFWLSFVAVGVLFASSWASAGRPTWRQRAWGLVRTQGVVSVALAPLTLMLFGQFSVAGLLANLLAIPWVTLLVTPLALLGTLVPGVWHAAAWSIAALLQGLAWCAALPWAVLERPALPWGLAALAALGGVVLVMRWPWGLRFWGLLLLWPALTYQPPRPPPGDFEVLAADVGQGTAVLVRTAQHTLLYDTGPAMGSHADAGQRVLVPLLRASGDRLDALVLSHNDNDHTGGAASVQWAHPQAPLWASFDTQASLGVPATRCEAGQQWTWDGVTFEFLHPSPEDYQQALPDNALSCVLRVGAGGTQALLTGDIPARQERQILATHPGLRATLLMAAHHGSKTSSDPAWLEALHPRWTVVQAGYRNRYGHPAPQVMARYDERHLAWVASPACGAAFWRSQHPDELLCHREHTRRYWHHVLDGATVTGRPARSRRSVVEKPQTDGTDE